MYKITIKINHCDDKKLEEVRTFESDDIDELKIDLKSCIETSFDNASHLLQKKLYPKKQLDMSLDIISSNFFKSEKAIQNFLNYNKNYIENLKTKSTSHGFFTKNSLILEEEDVIPSYTNYIEREKAFNKVKSQYKRWTEEQEIFCKSSNGKKKEVNKTSSIQKP